MPPLLLTTLTPGTIALIVVGLLVFIGAVTVLVRVFGKPKEKP